MWQILISHSRWGVIAKGHTAQTSHMWVILREHNLCDTDSSVHIEKCCGGVHQPTILWQLLFGTTLCCIQMLMAVCLPYVVDWSGQVASKFNWDVLFSMLCVNNTQYFRSKPPMKICFFLPLTLDCSLQFWKFILGWKATSTTNDWHTYYIYIYI